MKFRIFKPAKNAMQSGKKNTQKWLMLPIEQNNIRSIDEVTGWISANSTFSQLRYEFSNKENAIEFAKSSGFEFVVEEPKTPVIKKKSYAANFTG
jgi:hypothetical protein